MADQVVKEVVMENSMSVPPAIAVTTVFDLGKLGIELITADPHDGVVPPPKSVMIITPVEPGTYPVVVLLHGFFLLNSYYEQILRHMASHGYILVAPQLYTIILPNSTDDIKAAAAVTDWLPSGLPRLLPSGVMADFKKLALAGHSRGGHAAFSLALGHAETNLHYSALVGIDPVAGTSSSSQIPPKILTGEPESFDLEMPAMVIGTGLGSQGKNIFFPACAPDGVNHEEFYHECKAPSYHLVTRDFGHLDMLDDDAPKLVTCVCKDGSCKDKMRRSTAGIVVAFLNACLGDQGADLKAILKDPAISPATLDPVEYRV